MRLRPLTWREALQREALTCSEEFEVDGAGVVRKVLRRYDAEAGARFDLRHCLLCAQLPPVGNLAGAGITADLVERLLEDLPPVTARWLEACLEAINLRRPEDRERLVEVKATGLGKFFPFYVSALEVRCSEATAMQYHLYRVFDFGSLPKCYVLRGALSTVCRLAPVQYRAAI